MCLLHTTHTEAPLLLLFGMGGVETVQKITQGKRCAVVVDRLLSHYSPGVRPDPSGSTCAHHGITAEFGRVITLTLLTLILTGASPL